MLHHHLNNRSPPAHAPIPPPPHPTYDLASAVQAALDEDAATLGDLTSLATYAAAICCGVHTHAPHPYSIPMARPATATFLAKAPGVLAGLAVADLVFQLVDPSLRVDWAACDGDQVSPGTIIGRLSGTARSILRAERVALNFMQRMSGIATATAAMVAAAKVGGCAHHPTNICWRLLFAAA